MKIETLEDLFLVQLKGLYSAEKQLVKALPRMAKAAANKDLKTGFEEHLDQTKTHVERLEKIADELGKSLTGYPCKAMESLIEEGSELISDNAADAVRDAALVGAAQCIEHFEIASYGTARALAEQLGHQRFVKLLAETLEEEKETDQKLTTVAETMVNAQAATGK